MVTVLDNRTVPAAERTIVERTGDDSGGWAVAVIVLLAVLAIGGFVLMRYYNAPAAAPASNGGANINVTLPESPAQQPQGGTQQPAPSAGTPGVIPAQ